MDPIGFETEPSRYRHWKLSFDGPVVTLGMAVDEDGALRPGYSLKLNSYDLGVDIELADAIQRIRFGHPEVRALVVTSLRDRVFCAGANIFMLGSSSHPFKVNFCKFTNETRLALEELGACSGIGTLAALNGTASGGGYELALACDEILLVDDGSSAVSFPETPLLGVLPGTGGLTRLVDKRRVRRDHADVLSTTAEGIRGKRAVEWHLVDEVVPRSRFEARVRERVEEIAARSDRPDGASGVELPALEAQRRDDAIAYRYVTLALDRAKRTASLTVRAPDGDEPHDAAALLRRGAEAWAIRAWRELDDAVLHLRLNEPAIGVVLLRTEGDPERVLEVDHVLDRHRGDWLVREVLHHQKRVLNRLERTAKSLFALAEPGSAFAGSLLELALLADRSWALTGAEPPVRLALSPLNRGALPAAGGRSRLETRFLADPEAVDRLFAHEGPFDADAALEAGLVTFAPDDLDWDDEIRLACEERAAMNPDALTGMEANLRFPGPSTLETRIFARLSAWQNWIFARPNSTGARGSLRVYGQAGQRPDFDFDRT